MLATATRFPEDAHLLTSGTWIYERKLDGLRCIAVRDGSRVELWSRNRLSFNRRFPHIVEAVGEVPVPSFVLDGEIAAFEGERSTFQLLQSGSPAETRLVTFDLLYLLSRDTTGLPLGDRAGLLRQTVGDRLPPIMVSDHLAGDPADLLTDACEQRWEGLVAKRRDSPYRSGRSPAWRKLKCSARQELVIGGWTDPGGTRTAFGALLVGYYEEGALVYAGKVGTGFSEGTLQSLHRRLGELATEAPPFANPPRQQGAHWVRPELVAEIAFTEWTRDGRLRHPSFLGLREDKPARSVKRETPA